MSNLKYNKMRFTSIFYSIITLTILGFAACNGQENQLDSISKEILNPIELGPNTQIFDEVDQLPAPKDGLQSYYQFVASNLKYPEDAKNKGIEGKVMVEFIVTKEGTVSNVKVLKGIDRACDLAAAQVIAKSENWNPGIKDGKIVNTKIVLPIAFRLN